MLFFYVRHGDPIYNPDSLTPLGKRQAEAVAKRLAQHGIDKVYSSTSVRAIETATPLCELLKLAPPEQLEFAHERHTWTTMGVVPFGNGKHTWPWNNMKLRNQFLSREVRELGHQWYTHPAYAPYESIGQGMEYLRRETYAFLATLGYEWDEALGGYRVTRENNDRVALFAHGGFGSVFLSVLLDIPYPDFSANFEIGHTGVTVIEFEECEGICHPRIISFSNDGHLYREGLPTTFNGRVTY